MARLVVVSNRVPVPKTRGAQAGGLAVALKEVLTPGAIWFGWSGRISADTSPVPAQVEARGVTYATLDLSKADYERFYVGFANSALWPLFHFRPSLVRFRREDYVGYREVNRTLAEALAKLLTPGDIVWVHDYHLIPLARYLREAGIQNRIGFFLHIPFAPPSVLQTLPPVGELLADLCQYDLVGFQTREHARDFRDSCERLLAARVDGDRIAFGGRVTRAEAHPIGIDAEPFERDAIRASRSADTQRLAESLHGRALAIGVDRLDYSKGLPNRFDAYARLLGQYPEHLQKVSFLQIAARSREDVVAYRELARELDRLAGDMNGRFAEFDWTPLRYITRAAPRRTLAGFYRMARVGVVTPLHDGMNLVAKEFVAAQDSKDPGVLVLSHFAGAAEELTEALLVNPYDPDQIADAMHRALTMKLDERRERHAALRAKVFSTTAERYAKLFLGSLRNGDGASSSAASPVGAALRKLAQTDWLNVEPQPARRRTR
ncbi:MAG: trehalose-6-phosphate synthase [Alphaproteobacteria bacterium]|nr:trehalose-6-phosphate synthase [Alphaproteobacteria bacterium]